MNVNDPTRALSARLNLQQTHHPINQNTNPNPKKKSTDKLHLSMTF